VRVPSVPTSRCSTSRIATCRRCRKSAPVISQLLPSQCRRMRRSF
jgi:hypothetical protein